MRHIYIKIDNMEKTKLIELIFDGKTQREIGIELSASQTTVRYWLKVYGLATLNRRGRGMFKPRCCKRCGETDQTKFYGNDREVCSKCHNARVQLAAKEKREYAIGKLGGKCSNPECGFNKYTCSMDIHHLNPSKKDEHFKSMRGWSIERIDKEIEHCILLCRNCHAALHKGVLKL